MNKFRFRHATEKDAALVLEFIKGIAIYEDMLDEVINTEEQIREVVFAIITLSFAVCIILH